MDSTTLANKLCERFPEQERTEDTQDILTKVASLKQEEKTLKEYVEEAKELVYLIPQDWERLLAVRFAEGLAEKSTRCMVKGHIQVLKNNSKEIVLKDISKYALVCEEDEEEEKEQWTGHKQQDKLWRETVINQNKVLESITNQLSHMSMGGGHQNQGMENRNGMGAMMRPQGFG